MASPRGVATHAVYSSAQAQVEEGSILACDSGSPKVAVPEDVVVSSEDVQLSSEKPESCRKLRVCCALIFLHALVNVVLFPCLVSPPRISFEWTTMDGLVQNFTEAANDLETFAAGVKEQVSNVMPCDDSNDRAFEEACRSGTVNTTNAESGSERENMCRGGGTGMSKCEQGMCTALTVAAVGSARCSWVPFAPDACNDAAKLIQIVFSAYRFTGKLSRSLAHLRASLPHMADLLQVIGGEYAIVSSALLVLAAIVLTSIFVLACQRGRDQDKQWALTALVVVCTLANAVAVFAQESGWLDWPSEFHIGEFVGIMRWKDMSWCIIPLEAFMLWCVGALTCSMRLWWCGWIIISLAFLANIYVVIAGANHDCSLCRHAVSRIDSWCIGLGNLGSELADLSCGPAGILDPALRKLDGLTTCPGHIDNSLCQRTCWISKASEIMKALLGLLGKVLVMSALSPKHVRYFDQINVFTALLFVAFGVLHDVANVMAKSMAGLDNDIFDVIVLSFWGGLLLVASAQVLPKKAPEPHLPLPIILSPWIVLSYRTGAELFKTIFAEP